MEKYELIRMRTVSFVVIVLLLLAAAGGMTAVLVALQDRIASAETAERQGLVHLAIFMAAMIGATAILLLWAVLRYIRFRLWARDERHSLPYVDAWSVAGQRFKLKPEDQNSSDAGPEN